MKLVLQANLKPLWAEEVLQERGHRLAPESVRALTLLATGNEEEATRAWQRAVRDEQEQATRARGG